MYMCRYMGAYLELGRIAIHADYHVFIRHHLTEQVRLLLFQLRTCFELFQSDFEVLHLLARGVVHAHFQHDFVSRGVRGRRYRCPECEGLAAAPELLCHFYTLAKSRRRTLGQLLVAFLIAPFPFAFALPLASSATAS